MNKKTLLLILILALATAGLIYLAVKTPNTPEQQVALTPTPTVSPNAHSMLSLAQASATESSSSAGSLQGKTQSQTLAVSIQTTNKVNAVQLELSFDPKVLTNVTLTPGPFFTQPTILINSVNTNDGRISYALAQQLTAPGATGSGVVAYISFDTLPTAQKQTTISFLPKTAVTADGILESVLGASKNYTVDLTKVTPVQVIPTSVPATGSAN